MLVAASRRVCRLMARRIGTSAAAITGGSTTESLLGDLQVVDGL